MIRHRFVAQKMLKWNHSCTVAAHKELFCMSVVHYRTERSKVRRIVLEFLPRIRPSARLR